MASTLSKTLLLIAVLVGWHAHAASGERLTVGYFDLPPYTRDFSEPPADTNNGPAIRYFRAIAQRMGITAEFRLYPLARLLHSLERSELDAALILARSPERESRFIYPRQPWIYTRSAIIVRADSPLRHIRGPEDLAGMRIAHWSGGYIAPLLRHGSISLTPASGSEIRSRAMDYLLNCRVDAFYLPDALVLGQLPPGGELRKISLP